jgi:DNA-binding LacI/PurR family transcriptional regulator/signal transduction histidine kinase/ActR/RegA family two-component response regulator
MSPSFPGSPRRKKVAVLIDYMDDFIDGYETALRRAFDHVCRERDLDLFFVYGRAIAGPPEWCGGHNSIYQVLQRDSVDGIVLMVSSLAKYTGPAGVARLCRRYASMPLVAFGASIPQVPSILRDDSVGMQAVVEHLVRYHGCRRLAFIAGSPGCLDAIVRQDAFRSALEQCGVAFDPELVVCNDSASTKGRSAMEQLLRKGTIPDAVVCAADGVASGVIEAVRAHGLRVPRDLLVTGYDDTFMARLYSPPLTTVVQPFEPLAELAINLLQEQLAGRSVAGENRLPAQLVIRQSCGCPGRNKLGHFQPMQRDPRSPVELLRVRRPQFEQVLSQGLTVGCARAEGVGGMLLDALQSELEGHVESFIGALECLLEEPENQETCCQELMLMIGELRDMLREAVSPELDELWNDARMLIATFVSRHQAQRRLWTAEAHGRMARANEICLGAQDLPALSAAIADGLSEMGIGTCFVARYCDDALDKLEPLICWVDGKVETAPSSPFPASNLFPPAPRLDERRRSWLLFPLAIETLPLGLVIFESSPNVDGWQIYRDHIATAIRSITLLQEIVRKTTQHERSVQERLATAKRMDALSFLAGGVAHDLNNALGPLVALPEVLLRELFGTQGAAVTDVAELRGDLETIRVASARAAETIKDLLTMGRQGHATKDLTDLNHAVSNCMAAEPLLFRGDAARQLNTAVELNPEPLFIQGSEAHLIRAIANLVRNAVEAVDSVGSVAVKTRRVVLTEPSLGYETIEPGDYAVVSVSDSGKGIAPADLGRVFEPFFSRKKVGENCGSGLGLAIVHGVVKEHQGFADVQSQLGHGTTFALYFPSATAEPTHVAKSSDTPHGRAKILLIDDEPILLRTGRRVLAHLGYEVDTMASGKQALELFVKAAHGTLHPEALRTGRVCPYDLVLLDMQLNEALDGLQIAERIQEMFPRQLVIIASGHAPTERAELALGKGLVWLSKPYTTDSLGRAVATALKLPTPQ